MLGVSVSVAIFQARLKNIDRQIGIMSVEIYRNYHAIHHISRDTLRHVVNHVIHHVIHET